MAPLPDLDSLPPLPVASGGAPALPGPVGVPTVDMSAPARTHSGLTGLLVGSSHGPDHEDVDLPDLSAASLQLQSRAPQTAATLVSPSFEASPGFLEDEARFAEKERGKRESEPAPARRAPRDERAERIAAIAGFGPAPMSPLYDIPYFIRVYMRRRTLAEEVKQVIAGRKRAERKHVDALCEVGEVLYGRREDPTLSQFQRHFDTIRAADADVDRHQLAGAAARRDGLAEVERLEQQLDAIEQVMRPLQRLSEKLEQQLTGHRTALAEAEAEARRTDAQITKIRAAEEKAGSDEAQLAFLIAQRDDLSRRMQEIETAIEPRTQELGQVRLKLARQQEKADALNVERERLEAQVEREQKVHQRTAGTARGELRTALRALGEAALKAQVAQQLAERKAMAVSERIADLDRHRDREDMYRRAAASFDEEAYQRGMYELVGGTGLLMLTLIYQIFFW